jgi:hypothetical protein
MKKGVGSGVKSGDGSISQRYGSRDPHQNVMDPQHWIKTRSDKQGKVVSVIRSLL